MNNSNTKKVFASGRYVGDVIGGVFQKRIKGSRHILRTPRAIALSVVSLQQAEYLGAKEIEITDTESGILYRADVEHFKRYSFPLQRGGFEPQLALTLEKFDISSPLEISSHAPRRGEVKRKPGNGKRVRNPRGVIAGNVRQMVFKGMG